MRAFSLVHFAAAVLVVLAAFGATPASAGTLAYLSSGATGNCTTPTTPCSSMGSAIGVVGASGEVICLNKGRYGAAVFSQSITISCGDGLWEAPALGVSVETPAGAVVVIEGLVIDSAGSAGTNMGFTGQGTLHLRRARIGNSPSSTVSNPAHAVSFVPSGTATLIVSDSVFYNMGTNNASISAGINIKPASGVTANISIDRSSFEYNNFGIIADGTGGGIIRGLVKDSYVKSNRNNGITVSTGGNTSVLTIDNTAITGNNFGLAVAGGPNAGMLVRRSTITANATGLFSSGGAALLSYGDNAVNANTTTDGAFTGTVGLR